MMQGVANLRREATLTVVVSNSNQQLQAIDAVIDTEFNGFIFTLYNYHHPGFALERF